MCEPISRHGMSDNRQTGERDEKGEELGGSVVSVAYIESPHDPRAGSYKPPRTGFNRVSKVVSFSIFLTDTAWISSFVRNVNSTRSTEEDTGCEMFMMVWYAMHWRHRRAVKTRWARRDEICSGV